MKTSRLLLTITTGLVLAAPIASYAEGTTAPAAATAEKAGDAAKPQHHKHHRHHAKGGDQKSTEDAAKGAAK